MNKIITTILSLLLLLSICPTGSAAETEAQPDENLALVKVTAPSVSSLPDREITIPVSIEEIQDSPIWPLLWNMILQSWN